jgi:hypothetical protein
MGEGVRRCPPDDDKLERLLAPERIDAGVRGKEENRFRLKLTLLNAAGASVWSFSLGVGDRERFDTMRRRDAFGGVLSISLVDDLEEAESRLLTESNEARGLPRGLMLIQLNGRLRLGGVDLAGGTGSLLSAGETARRGGSTGPVECALSPTSKGPGLISGNS